MMNHAVKKLTSAALALALSMSMGVMASAAPTATDYSVNLSGTSVQFVKNGQVTATYQAKAGDVTVMQNASGNLLITFVREETGKTVGVNLASQSDVVLNGSYTSLTLDKSLPADKTVTVAGAVGTLTVSAPINVTVGDSAKITSLRVTDAKATVNALQGSAVTKAAAVDATKVTGITGVAKLAASTTKKSAATTSKSTTTEKTSSKTEATTSKNKETGTVDMSEADETKYTKDIYFSDDLTVEFTAKAGYSLGSCMKDVKLAVENEKGNKISGKWNWTTGNYNTKTSGTYKYQFVPSSSYQYNPITINVVFTSSGTTGSLSKPSLSFASGQRSHGKEEDCDRVTIEVGIPDEVEDDDRLYIYVDNDEYEDYDVDEGDAGEDNEYTLDLSKFYEKDEKVRIKVKVERSNSNKTSTSKTITYNFD